MIKKIFLILLLAVGFSTTWAQKKVRNHNSESFRALYFDISRYADSLFLHTSDFNYCTSGIVFIRFEIADKGRIANVHTNEGAPGFLDSIIKRVLTNKKLPGTKKNDQPFILPLLYSITNHCLLDTGRKLGPMAELLKKIPGTLEPTKDGWVYSFKNMLNFGSIKKQKNYQSTNYNILPPAEIKTPVY